MTKTVALSLENGTPMMTG